LQVFGNDFETEDGTCVRDYTHVMDLAEAHVLALSYLANGGKSIALNLGTGRGTSVFAMLRSIQAITGRTVPHTIGSRRPGDPPCLYADASRAQKVLGWAAQRSVEDMVTSAWRWELQRHKRATGN
jgi:UDP-glucose 4-epimerase